MSRRARGVTLIELLVAVALGFILVMLAVPAYTTWVADAEVSSAASAIADGLRKANAEAIKQNTGVEFVLTPATGWQARVSSTGTVFAKESFSTGAKNATVGTNNGSTMVTFTALGQIEKTNSDATDPIDYVVVNATGSTRNLRVLVGQGTTRTGIRVCDPHFSWPTDPKGCP